MTSLKSILGAGILGAGLVLGGCRDNKEKEELVFRQLFANESLEQRDENGVSISQVEDFGWYTLISSYAYRNKNQLAKSTYVYLITDRSDSIVSTIFKYNNQDQLIKATNFYTYKDKENREITKIDSIFYRYNDKGEFSKQN